jgi:TPR repeat protein
VIAAVLLARCCERGVGVSRDVGEAVRMYRAAAQRGSVDAYRALERLYDAIRPDDPMFRHAGAASP